MGDFYLFPLFKIEYLCVGPRFFNPMLKDFYNSIINAGIKYSADKDTRDKIQLSNFLALFISLGVAVPFVIISYYFARPVTFIPLIACLWLFVVIFMNKVGLYVFSRINLALAVICIIPAYHGYMVPDGGDVLNASLILSICFSLIPFLIFNLKEWKYTAVISVITLLEILFFDKLTGFSDQPIDDSFLREGLFARMTSFLGVIGAFTAVGALSVFHARSKKENEELVSEMEAKQQDLIQSQEEMEENLEELRKAKKEEQKRQWITEGQARFAQMMRQHDELKEMADEFVSELTRYLKANQAGFFALEEEGEDKYLDLKACYAYDRKKFLEKRIEIGQGLVGQAYLEKDYTYLTEIPHNYVRITSGLGKSTPNSLLVVPFMYNEEVTGVVEIASFNEFEDYQIEFVMKLGEVVASTLNAHRTADRTKRLLEETQESHEMMRAQEEEMRQNMEELAATQEDLQRKEQDYEEKIAELEERLKQFEQQTIDN